MKSVPFAGTAVMAAIVSLAAGCSTWDSMNPTDRGTTVGAAGGAVAGAVVGGPVGAVVGGVGGGIAGHEMTDKMTDNDAKPNAATTSSSAQTQGSDAMGSGTSTASSDGAQAMSRATFVRSVQQALNDKGYHAGKVDGIYGPNTQGALRQFQKDQGIKASGHPDAQTVAALGVAMPVDSSLLSMNATRGNRTTSAVRTHTVQATQAMGQAYASSDASQAVSSSGSDTSGTPQ